VWIDKFGDFSFNYSDYLTLINYVSTVYGYCLQCFDAVGWAAGTASGL